MINLNKFIWFGDPHAKKSNLKETSRLVKWVDKVALDRKVPIVLAGDQYNDFGIAKVEVVDFWVDAFNSMKSEVFGIVGNHDANSEMSMNFMDIHAKQITVINSPLMVGNIGLIPFYRDNDVFIKAMDDMANSGCKWIMCHQEFNGCQYENGFYAPGGVDPAVIPESIEMVIGGHIHAEQAFGKVWYPGTARHLTKSDAGQQKGVWFVDLEKNIKERIDTPVDVAEPFIVLDINPNSVVDFKNMKTGRTFINLTGPVDFIKSTLKKIPEGVKVRPLPDQEEPEGAIKESDGIPKAFFDYSLEYANKNKLGNEEIKTILSKIYKKCPKLKGASA